MELFPVFQKNINCIHQLIIIFILTLPVPCGKVKDSRVTEASEAFIINSQCFREESITEGEGKYILLLNLY